MTKSASAIADHGRHVATRGSLRPASTIETTGNPAMTRRFLEILTAPQVGCVELRVLRAVQDRRGCLRRGEADGGSYAGSTWAGWYDDLKRLEAQARLLRGVSGYVSINPVSADLLARRDNQLGRVRHTTRDSDIACLRWLYLDIDPVRPPDISSTDSELAGAIARRDSILGEHPELAASALWGQSGNGTWILIRLPDYPNDPPHRELVAETVRLLAGVYSDRLVLIDNATVNPARLIGLPGTLKAKGSPRPDRPWRLVTLDGAGHGAVASESR
jgi:hypothetical protein